MKRLGKQGAVKRWMAVVATAAVAGTVGAVTAPAAAGDVASERATDSASDPDDVGNRLDIVHERVTVRDDGRVTMRLRTAETWRCGYLQNFGQDHEAYSAALLWDFDRGADGHFGDIVGSFGCGPEGGLVFHLHHSSGQHPDRTFDARRPTAQSASVTIPRRALHSRHLNLRAVSRFNGTKNGHTAVEEDDHTPVLRGY